MSASLIKLQTSCCKKLTHPGPAETEIAESKRRDPKGPTFVFCTSAPFLVRSNLLVSCCPTNPTAYNKHGILINTTLNIHCSVCACIIMH